jgi:hypothetical protein
MPLAVDSSGPEFGFALLFIGYLIGQIVGVEGRDQPDHYRYREQHEF